jgi:hypothetical protein
LLGRPASQETLAKLTAALDDAHTVRARLGDGGESDVIGPDEIDKLPEPAKRLAGGESSSFRGGAPSASAEAGVGAWRHLPCQLPCSPPRTARRLGSVAALVVGSWAGLRRGRVRHSRAV